MHIVLVKFTTHRHCLPKIVRYALPNTRPHQAAPSALREVEVCRFLSKILSINTNLEGRAEHYVVGNVFKCTIFLWELKEYRFIHCIVGIVSVADLRHLCVEVPDKGVLPVYGFFHQVHVGGVGGRIEYGRVESPWLLGVAPAGSVVAGEGVEGAYLVPPGAELGGGAVTTEAADVRSHQGNTEHIHFHRGED
jgi:hypothetical protein